MSHDEITQQLAQHHAIFKAMLENIPEIQYRWKPSPDKWCLLEIICHLYDEEREDFRIRVKHVLEQPEAPIPPNDPVGWVNKREYMEQNYNDKVAAFLEERTQSVNWLRSLKKPVWSNTYQHKHFGPMSASYFLSNWLAHDYLHFRQINHIKYEYFAAHNDHALVYAGNW